MRISPGAGQLAMLPEIADLQPEPVNIEDAKIGDGALNEDQAQKVKQILKKHQSHLIGGGNAVPKPAKGVVCDIDVGDHPPISLPARRVKPEILVNQNVAISLGQPDCYCIQEGWRDYQIVHRLSGGQQYH